MRVYACVWFRDDCLSLLVDLYSETACKDSINNWNMQTFFYFFMVFMEFCLFFWVFGGKLSLCRWCFVIFCFSGWSSFSSFSRLIYCQTRIRRSACACCNDCCFAALGNRTSSLSPQIRNLRGPLLSGF